jgi:hypothetical protein
MLDYTLLIVELNNISLQVLTFLLATNNNHHVLRHHALRQNIHAPRHAHVNHTFIG